ncbi:hypothetical protein CHN50_13935 [Priestia aryabhattai]|uniref:GNAT family N-acetyltransferase n=1 Tax=Priestia TaxID=2800373 RepID=UPI000BA0713A|nr:hypothetical protein CHN50_13935 [Priestia aryabhattai]USY53828.1 GNAT family N-acetyltransferase [Bacillus sp. 1780r2a1]
MNSYSVTKAVESDFLSFSELKNQVQKLHIKGRPDLYEKKDSTLSRGEYQKWLESAETELLVVRDTEKSVVGYVILDFKKAGDTNPILKNRCTLFIRSIGISEDHQSKGIGKLLMNEIVKYGREKSVDAIELNVLEFNDRAIQFYENIGFTTKSRQMELLF